MRAFWDRESDSVVGRILSEMLGVYEANCDVSGTEANKPVLEKARALVGRLTGKPREARSADILSGFLRQEFACAIHRAEGSAR